MANVVNCVTFHLLRCYILTFVSFYFISYINFDKIDRVVWLSIITSKWTNLWAILSKFIMKKRQSRNKTIFLLNKTILLNIFDINQIISLTIYNNIQLPNYPTSDHVLTPLPFVTVIYVPVCFDVYWQNMAIMNLQPCVDGPYYWAFGSDPCKVSRTMPKSYTFINL